MHEKDFSIAEIFYDIYAFLFLFFRQKAMKVNGAIKRNTSSVINPPVLLSDISVRTTDETAQANKSSTPAYGSGIYIINPW